MSKFISNNGVYRMAQDVKNYVESNGKFLYKASYDNEEFTWQEMTDIMTYVLLNLKHNVNADTPKWCVNAFGDNIVENIYKEDYLDQARRVHEYIIKNGQVPNYTATKKSKKKVNIDLYTYCIAKILVWYKNHGDLPNYCTYDYRAFTNKPTPSKKKYGHATVHCCDDMGQNNGYYCGCHALQEVFRNLTGIVVPQSTIAGWAGTTSAGTGHSGLDTAVAKFNSKYGKNLKVQWKNFSDIGWTGIKNIINSNNQDVIIHNLYRNQWGHYEVINKDYGDYCDVQNSLGSTCNNGCYYGYVEERYHSTFESYMNGISQKSVMVITNA